MTNVLIGLAFVVYIVIVCVSAIQNRLLITSADKRLAKANEMVLTLAHSADKLAESVSELKDMMVHLESVYTTRNDALSKNRDEFRDAYIKLLKKYETQEDELRHLETRMREKYEAMNTEAFNTLQEIARKPTITNNPAR